MRKAIFFLTVLLFTPSVNAENEWHLKVVNDIADFGVIGDNEYNKLDHLQFVNNMLVGRNIALEDRYFEFYSLDDPIAPESVGFIDETDLITSTYFSNLRPIVGDGDNIFFFSSAPNPNSNTWEYIFINAIADPNSETIVDFNLQLHNDRVENIGFEDVMVDGEFIYILEARPESHPRIWKVQFSNNQFSFIDRITFGDDWNSAAVFMGIHEGYMYINYAQSGLNFAIIDLTTFTVVNDFYANLSFAFGLGGGLFVDEANGKVYLLASTEDDVLVYDATDPLSISLHTTIENTNEMLVFSQVDDLMFMNGIRKTHVMDTSFVILDTLSYLGQPISAEVIKHNATHYFNYVGYIDRTDVIEYSQREFIPPVSSSTVMNGDNSSSSQISDHGSESENSLALLHLWKETVVLLLVVSILRSRKPKRTPI